MDRLKRNGECSTDPSASVIQLAEGRAFTPEVAGSTPAGGTLRELKGGAWEAMMRQEDELVAAMIREMDGAKA